MPLPLQKEKPSEEASWVFSREPQTSTSVEGPKEGQVAINSQVAQNALESFGEYMRARMEKTNFTYALLSGPNFDDCYWYRYMQDDTHQYDSGEDGETINVKRQIAKTVGIPDAKSVSNSEKTAQRYMNYMARVNSSELKNGEHVLILKHFPGGDVKIETTEYSRNVVYQETLEQLIGGHMTPFLEVLDSPKPPLALMTSHAHYPNIDKDIALIHPEIVENSILPPTVSQFIIDETNTEYSIPATFSPYIIRGLLREELGYTGVVVSDWANMESLDRFLRTFGNVLGPDIQKLNLKTSQKVVLAVDAGVNYLLGMVYRGYARGLPKEEMESLKNYADKNPQWLAKLDEIIEFNIGWCKQNFTALSNVSTPNISEISFEDKINLYLGFSTNDKQLAKFTRKVNSNNFTDLRNRQGLLTLVMRSMYLEELTGLSFPKRDDYPNAAQWLGVLYDNEKFQTEYNKVDWTCAQSSEAWKIALENIRSKEIANK